MGPALEGMNIERGMTADPGAIDHVWTDEGTARYSVIGNGAPAGISGTGVDRPGLGDGLGRNHRRGRFVHCSGRLSRGG